MTKEKFITPYSAYIVLLVHFILLVISLLMFVPKSFETFGVFFLLFTLLMIKGYYINNTNEATVFTLFGTYQSTSIHSGFYWVNPFYKRQKVSLKMHSLKIEKEIIYEVKSKKVKVTAIINWKIKSPSKAIFETEDYIYFVSLQAEATLTEIIGTSLYDIATNKTNVVFMPDKATIIHQLFEKKLRSKLEKIGAEPLEIKVG